MKRMYPKKKGGNKVIFSLAKPIIASANIVDNDNIVFSVEIENEIAKEDTIAETYIQMEVKKLQDFFSKDSEIKKESVEECMLSVDKCEDKITNVQDVHISKIYIKLFDSSIFFLIVMFSLLLSQSHLIYFVLQTRSYSVQRKREKLF